jgi:hypothetical protein
MKKLSRFAVWALSLCLSAIVYCSCSLIPDPPVDGEEEPVEEISSEKADSLLSLLSFTSGTKVTGSVPFVTNTELVKTNSEDTIYSMSGLKMPLRLTNPTGVTVGGWFVAAKNSTFYYDVALDETEGSDTVTIVIIEIPGESTSTYTIPLEITPYDDNKKPIDIIVRELLVEVPEPNKCNIYTNEDPSAPIRSWEWIWSWTLITNSSDEGVFVNAPGYKRVSRQSPTGCCLQQPWCPQYICDPISGCKWVYDSQVDAVTAYSIEHEFYNFYKDGTYERNTNEYKKNFDPIATDWCNKVPGYIEGKNGAHTTGTYTYVPGSKLTLTASKTECEDGGNICGYGSRWGDVRVGCYSLIVTIDRLLIENTKEVRLYSRSPASPVFKP